MMKKTVTKEKSLLFLSALFAVVLALTLSFGVRNVLGEVPQEQAVPAAEQADGDNIVYHVLADEQDAADTETTKEITRTIHYRYLKADGAEAAKDVVQKVTFTRTAETDAETGNVTYTEWKAQVDVFAEAVSPEISGYVADKEKIAELKAEATMDDTEETVVYTEKTYWVMYVNDDQTVIQDKITQKVGADEPKAPADPTRDGFTFNGWDRSVDANGNVTYTAKWKAVDTAPVLGIDKTAFISRNDTFTYTITQAISADAESVVITDTLEKVLTYVSKADEVSVLCDGQAVTGAKVEIDGQKLTVTIADASSLRGKTVTISFKAKALTDVDMTSYAKDNIAVIPNTVQTTFNNDSARAYNSNTVSVKVSLSSGNDSDTTGKSNSNKNVQTGDEQNIGLFVALFLLSGAALIVAVRRRSA